MDRQIIYDGQVPQTLDILNTNKNTMLAIAKMAADVFGTSTIATGLACVPTAPATMSVNVNPGQIYQNVVVDQTAYSDIALDTSHSIVKSGILMDAQNFAITAPGTAGFSQNYLIQATFLETDTANTVLPYYNSANPSQALNGPGGSGSTQPTRRAGQVSLQLLAGTAATTGTQTTPAVTAGYIGLWVVTVANGASSITSGNIAPYPGQPILPSSILASIQNGNLSYAVATGTANAHTIALTPALTSRVDGMMIRYKAPAANTGAVTLADGVGTANVLGANHSALQGGEYIANGDALVVWNSSISGGSYILLECTGGAVQVASATQSQHAVQFGQVRQRLTANTNFYVNASTGSDSNNGLTSGTAWATLQKAWNTIQSNYDVAGFTATVNVAAGSYAPVAGIGAVVGSISASSVQFVATGAATVTNTSGVACFYATGGAQFTYSGPWTLINNNSGASTAQSSGAGSILIQGAGVTHGASAGSHMLANAYGQIQATGNYTVSGSSGSHLNAANAGALGINSGVTVTLSGTPAFSTAFAQANGLSQINAGSVTFSGSATGSRYISQSNSMVNSNSGGASYFPGNAAGSTNTGGIYI